MGITRAEQIKQWHIHKKKKPPNREQIQIINFNYNAKDKFCQGGKMLYKIDSPYLYQAMDDYITDCEPKMDRDFERELEIADERYHRDREDDE